MTMPMYPNDGDLLEMGSPRFLEWAGPGADESIEQARQSARRDQESFGRWGRTELTQPPDR